MTDKSFTLSVNLDTKTLDSKLKILEHQLANIGTSSSEVLSKIEGKGGTTKVVIKVDTEESEKQVRLGLGKISQHIRETFAKTAQLSKEFGTFEFVKLEAIKPVKAATKALDDLGIAGKEAGKKIVESQTAITQATATSTKAVQQKVEVEAKAAIQATTTATKVVEAAKQEVVATNEVVAVTKKLEVAEKQLQETKAKAPKYTAPMANTISAALDEVVKAKKPYSADKSKEEELSKLKTNLVKIAIAEVEALKALEAQKSQIIKTSSRENYQAQVDAAKKEFAPARLSILQGQELRKFNVAFKLADSDKVAFINSTKEWLKTVGSSVTMPVPAATTTNTSRVQEELTQITSLREAKRQNLVETIKLDRELEADATRTTRNAIQRYRALEIQALGTASSMRQAQQLLLQGLLSDNEANRKVAVAPTMKAVAKGNITQDQAAEQIKHINLQYTTNALKIVDDIHKVTEQFYQQDRAFKVIEADFASAMKTKLGYLKEEASLRSMANKAILIDQSTTHGAIKAKEVELNAFKLREANRVKMQLAALEAQRTPSNTPTILAQSSTIASASVAIVSNKEQQIYREIAGLKLQATQQEANYKKEQQFLASSKVLNTQRLQDFNNLVSASGNAFNSILRQATQQDDQLRAIERNRAASIREEQQRLVSDLARIRSLPSTSSYVRTALADQRTSTSATNLSNINSTASNAAGVVIAEQRAYSERLSNYREFIKSYEVANRAFLDFINKNGASFTNVARGRIAGNLAASQQGLTIEYEKEVAKVRAKVLDSSITQAEAQHRLNSLTADYAGNLSRVTRLMGELDQQHIGVLGKTLSYAVAWRSVNLAINTVKGVLSSVPKAGIEQQSNMSTLEAGMATNAATGNINLGQGKELAAVYMEKLRGEAKRTGIELEGLEKNFANFTTSAILTGNSINSTWKDFQHINEVVTALHMPTERANLVMLALTQIMNKGKVQSEELVKQLGNLLPGAFASFAASSGRTTAQLVKDMKKGQVSAQELSKFLDYYAQRFEGAFGTASGGLNAELNRAKNSLTELERSLFAISSDRITSVVKSFTSLVSGLTASNTEVVKLKHTTDKILDTSKWVAYGAAILAVIGKLGTLALSYSTVLKAATAGSAVTLGARLASIGTVALANPVTAIAVGVSLLGYMVYNGKDFWDRFWGADRSPTITIQASQDINQLQAKIKNKETPLVDKLAAAKEVQGVYGVEGERLQAAIDKLSTPTKRQKLLGLGISDSAQAEVDKLTESMKGLHQREIDATNQIIRYELALKDLVATTDDAKQSSNSFDQSLLEMDAIMNPVTSKVSAAQAALDKYNATLEGKKSGLKLLAENKSPQIPEEDRTRAAKELEAFNNGTHQALITRQNFEKHLTQIKEEEALAAANKRKEAEQQVLEVVKQQKEAYNNIVKEYEAIVAAEEERVSGIKASAGQADLPTLYSKVEAATSRIAELSATIGSNLANGSRTFVENFKQLPVKDLATVGSGMSDQVRRNIKGNLGDVGVSSNQATIQTIREVATKRGFDSNLLLAMAAQESNFKNTARSGVGAQGVFQFMPPTAERFKVNLDSVASQANGAIDYMNLLLKMFNGDLKLAVAAYNAGEGTAQQVLKGKRDFKQETKDYVPSVLGTREALGGRSSPAATTAAKEELSLNKDLTTEAHNYNEELKKQYATRAEALSQITQIVELQAEGDKYKLADIFKPEVRDKTYKKETIPELNAGNLQQVQASLVEGDSIARNYVEQLNNLDKALAGVKVELQTATSAKELEVARSKYREISDTIKMMAVDQEILTEKQTQTNAALQEYNAKVAKGSLEAVQIEKGLKRDILKAGKDDQQIYMLEAENRLTEEGVLLGAAKAAELEKILALYQELQQVTQTANIINGLVDGVTSGLEEILKGTKSWGKAFEDIFTSTVSSILHNSMTNLVKGVKTQLSNLFKGGNFDWSAIGTSLIEVAGGALVSWLSQSPEKATPSKAMQVTNTEVYGQAQMAIADSSGRNTATVASLPAIQQFNSALDVAATAIRVNAGKIWDFSSSYLSKISSSLFGDSVNTFMSGISSKITSAYDTVVGWGDKLIGGVKGLVMSAGESLGITTASNGLNSTVGNAAGNAATKGAGDIPYIGSALAVLKLGYDLFTISGNKFMTTTDKVIAGLSSAGDAAFSIGIGLAATGAGLPAAAIAFAVSAGMKFVSSITDVIANGFNLQNTMTLGAGAIGAAIAGPIGFIVGTMLGSLLGSLFSKPPSATVLSYQTPDKNAQVRTSELGDYHVSSGGKSGTVGVTTDFGEVDMRLNNISKNSSLMIDEATKAFLPLLRTIKAFDGALATSIRVVDKSLGQDSFKDFKILAEHTQKLSKLDTSKFVTDRLGDISKSLGATGTTVGKTIEVWWNAFSGKMLKSDSKENSSYNTTTAFNIEAFIAAELPKLVQLPLKLADLFVQSVKSVADGATQKQFEGQMNDFFAGWEYAKEGIAKLGIDISTTALPEYLTSLVNIGMTVKDSAGALVAFAGTFDAAAGEVTAQFNAAFARIFSNAKEQGYNKEQTSGYVTSYIALSGVAKDTGLSVTEDDLNSLANSLNNAASLAITTANGVIDQAIATADLGKMSREAAIQQLSLTGALTAEQIAAGNFSKALVDQQKIMFSGIEFANQNAILTGQTIAEMGLSFVDVANIGANLTNTFKDMAEAMNFMDSVAKAVYSPEVYASKKKDQAAASFSSAASTLGLGKDYTTQQFATFFDTKGDEGYAAKVQEAMSKGDSGKANALKALGASYTVLTEATTTYTQAVSSASSASSTAAKSVDQLTSILEGVAKQLYDLSHTELEVKIHDIQVEIEGLAKSAMEAGGSISNLSELSTAKLAKLTKDWMKPVEDSLKTLGKSDLQVSILSIGEKFAKLEEEAGTLATNNLVDLEDTLKSLNTLKLADLRKAFKPLEDELLGLGNTKYSTGVANISKWYTETIAVSDSLAEAYGVSGDVAISWINKIKDARISALNEEHDKIMADNAASQAEFMTSKFKQDNPDAAGLGSSLLSLRSNLLSSITGLIQAGGDYSDVTRLISTAVTAGTDLIISAQANIANRYKAIFNTIQSTLDTGTKMYLQTKLTVNPDGTSNKADIEEMTRQLDIANAIKQIHDEDFNTQMSGINSLLSLQQTKYNTERDAILATIDYAKSLKDHVKDLRVNNTLSPLSNEERFKEAQKQAYETFNLAKSPVDSKERQDARSKLSSKADTYLNEAKAFYASSPEYAKIFEEVTTALDTFGSDTLDPQQQLVNLNKGMLEELTQSRIYLEGIKGQQTSKQASELSSIDSIVRYITESFSVSFADIVKKTNLEVPEAEATGGIYQPIIDEIVRVLEENGFSEDNIGSIKKSLTGFAGSITDMLDAGIDPSYTKRVSQLATDLYNGVGDLIGLNLLSKDQGSRVFSLGIDFYTSLNKTLKDAKISPEAYNSILTTETEFTSSVADYLKAGYITGETFTSIISTRETFNTNILDALRKGTITPTEAGAAYDARNAVTTKLYEFLGKAGFTPEDTNTIVQGFSTLSTTSGYMIAALGLTPEQIAFISKGYGDSAKGVGSAVGMVGLSEEDKQYYQIGTSLFSQNVGKDVGAIGTPTKAITTVQAGIEGMATNVYDGLTSVEFLKPAGDLVISGINNLAGNIAYGLSHALDTIDPSPITNAINGLVASIASMIATQRAPIAAPVPLAPAFVAPIRSTTPGIDAFFAGDMTNAIAEASKIFTQEEIAGFSALPRADQTNVINSLIAQGKTFKEGGIATEPSIFGEAGAEAAVPLSGGRYIPVKFTNTTSNIGLTKAELHEEISRLVDTTTTNTKVAAEGHVLTATEVQALQSEIKVLSRKLEKLASA